MADHRLGTLASVTDKVASVLRSQRRRWPSFWSCAVESSRLAPATRVRWAVCGWRGELAGAPKSWISRASSPRRSHGGARHHFRARGGSPAERVESHYRSFLAIRGELEELRLGDRNFVPACLSPMARCYGSHPNRTAKSSSIIGTPPSSSILPVPLTACSCAAWSSASAGRQGRAPRRRSC